MKICRNKKTNKNYCLNIILNEGIQTGRNVFWKNCLDISTKKFNSLFERYDR